MMIAGSTQLKGRALSRRLAAWLTAAAVLVSVITIAASLSECNPRTVILTLSITFAILADLSVQF
jgi:hypothetical protein